MEFTFDRILGILGVIGIFVGLGVAIAMDPRNKGEMIFSISCFLFSGIALSLTVGFWAFGTNLSAARRIVIVGPFFIVICVSMVEASRWAAGRYYRATAATPEASQGNPEAPKKELEAHGTTDTLGVKAGHHGTSDTATAKAERPKLNPEGPKEKEPTAEEIAEAIVKKLPRGESTEVLPLSVEFHVASPKIVTVLNHGREIQDVRLRLTEYGYTAETPWSDTPAVNGKPAVMRKPPKRVTFYQLQGYFMDIRSIPANTNSVPLDLWAIKSLGFRAPGESRPPSAIPSDAFGFYALRLTFRDPNTGKRYAYVRVISDEKYGWPPDDPDKTINYSSTGTLPHHVFEDMVKDMLEHQKELYKDGGEEDYRP